MEKSAGFLYFTIDRTWYIPLREISPTMFAPFLLLLFSGFTVSLSCKEFPFFRRWTCWKMIVLRLFKGKPPEISMIHGHIILSSPISTISTCRRRGNLHVGFEKSPCNSRLVCCKAFMCFSTAKMGAYSALHCLPARDLKDLRRCPTWDRRPSGGEWGLWCFLSSRMGEPYKPFLFRVLSRTKSCSKAKMQTSLACMAGELWSRIFPTEWGRELWTPTPAFQWVHFPSQPWNGVRMWPIHPSCQRDRDNVNYLLQGTRWAPKTSYI